LLAQKIALFATVLVSVANVPGRSRPVKSGTAMDLGIIAALAMLVLWAVGTFFLDAPGWINLLLTAGMFLLIWRVTIRGNTKERSGGT
jgi:hypothetical protein